MFVKNLLFRGMKALGFMAKSGKVVAKKAKPVQIASSGAKNAVNNVTHEFSKTDLMKLMDDYDIANPFSFSRSYNSYM